MDPKIVLPPVYGAKPAGKPPHRAPVVARYTDDHGVEYRVTRNRTATTWWLQSSKDGYRMSGDVRTTSKRIADGWLEAMAQQRFVVLSRAQQNGCRGCSPFGRYGAAHTCGARCSTCRGTGDVECPACEGNGCKACRHAMSSELARHGAGEVEYGEVPCPDCSGSGRRD